MVSIILHVLRVLLPMALVASELLTQVQQGMCSECSRLGTALGGPRARAQARSQAGLVLARPDPFPAQSWAGNQVALGGEPD